MASTDTGGTQYFCFEGNGSVVALVDAATGTTSARYEYDPFGNVVLQTGTASSANTYRFSTKCHDAETGLVYYGYRYYAPYAISYGVLQALGNSAVFNNLWRARGALHSFVKLDVTTDGSKETDWVPGDWGYLKNSNPPDGDPLVVGENLLYVGVDAGFGYLGFWGVPARQSGTGSVPADWRYGKMAKEGWEAEVMIWSKTKKDKPVWEPSRNYPQIGIQP